MDGDAQPQRVTFRGNGDTLTGRVYGTPFTGRVDNGVVRFTSGSYRWRARVLGDSLDGWVGVPPDSSRFHARRYRAVAPRLVDITTPRYSRQVAVAPPLATLHLGDTVHVVTADAGGWGPTPLDAPRVRLAPGGNPLAGPFTVEGAVPGDVLVVRLLRVRLNRDWAFSGTELMETAITPGYAADRTRTSLDNRWRIDPAAGVARLANPPEALRNFSVPLAPFLGVIATAPSPDYAPSSREAGGWGGNMEYGRLREGATVYLPVRTLGAALYLGDGHAAQGDGELAGDARETTLDVTSLVELERWGFQELVRAEDDDALMSVGTGGSLDEALRRATSDMARWLVARYALDDAAAAVVMGSALKFDVADVVLPSYGVVARMPKQVLVAVPRR